MTARAPVSDPAERGRDALARGAWDEARGCYEQVLERSDSAEAWDGLSWACLWLEDEAALLQAREHAYRLYEDLAPAPEHGWLATLEAEMARSTRTWRRCFAATSLTARL